MADSSLGRILNPDGTCVGMNRVESTSAGGATFPLETPDGRHCAAGRRQVRLGGWQPILLGRWRSCIAGLQLLQPCG